MDEMGTRKWKTDKVWTTEFSSTKEFSPFCMSEISNWASDTQSAAPCAA